MSRTLFELAGKNTNQKFSPHCWKSHLALNHKGLAFDSQPVQYHQYAEKLHFTDYRLLPILKDDDRIITDSWNIAGYLEKHYPSKPLFDGDSGKAAAQSMNHYCDTTLSKFIRPLILMSVFELISDEDKFYFRTSREKKLGMTLEEFSTTAPKSLIELKKELLIIADKLKTQSFLTGELPVYEDICLFCTLIWVACVNDTPFLEDNNIVKRWYKKMLEIYPDANKAINIKI